MNCCELVMFASALSCGIAECCTQEQIDLLAALLVQIGDTLATLSVCEASNCPSEDNTTEDIV